MRDITRKGRHLFAILDQAFYSSANFLINVLLARTLTPAEYGLFGSAFAAFLLISLLHSALVIEPLLVYASKQDAAHLSGYFRALRTYQVKLSALLLVIVISVSSAARSHSEYLLHLVYITPSALAVLLYYLYRRACYVARQVHIATASSAVYLIASVIVLVALKRLNLLDIDSAFLAMGVAALAATGSIHFAATFPRLASSVESYDFKAVRAEHIRYGKWALGAGVMIWFPGNLYYFVLPQVAELGANGAFKALMNFVMPMIQANQALANVLLPELAGATDHRRFSVYFRTALFAIGAICLIFWLLLGLLSRQLFEVLYAGHYADSAWLLWIAGALPFVSWLALAWRSAINAKGRPDIVFRSNALGAVFVTTIGIALMYMFTLTGAIVAMVLSYAAIYMSLRRTRLNRMPDGVLASSKMRAS